MMVYTHINSSASRMNSSDDAKLLILSATCVFCHSPKNTLPKPPTPISLMNLSSEYGIFMRAS